MHIEDTEILVSDIEILMNRVKDVLESLGYGSTEKIES